MTPDVLGEDRPGRPRALALAGGAVLLVGLAALALRPGPDRPPAQLRLTGIDGSALLGDSFVRFHVELRGSGIDRIQAVQLTSGASTSLGQVDRQGDGRTSVQLDLVPDCTGTLGLVAPQLEVKARAAGRDRLLLLDVPTDGAVGRLVRYRCAH